ncbi:type VII secretion protein EssC [Enterococcus sp. CWB-B31]|uniref:type VII secretion protein EssC n=1 Tax=Enterococcus sp. CWB-B31 TaxID=2885159 RepID=UPI001E3149F7|nr:type VII secretion protein EssC [Enterococcus sp. CWB-B31]MCB5954296.1 type VII secretion protein EssC [Enterococcus sp. CWB-B31]
MTAEQKLTLIVTPAKKIQIFDLLDKKELLISNQKNVGLTITDHDFSALLKKINAKWQLILISGSGMLNNQYMIKSEYLLKKGDEISFGIHTLKIFHREIHATFGTVIDTELCEIDISRYEEYTEYPDFHRSPRIIYRGQKEEITINSPSAPLKAPNDQLIKTILPPITMLAVTGVMAFFRSNVFFMMASGITTLMTVGFSIHSYFKNRREYKKDMEKRDEGYSRYLTDKAITLYQLNEKQKLGQLYHFPDIIELLKMGRSYNARIYEKIPGHYDFLFYRLGLGKISSTVKLTYANKERQGETDALERQAYELYSKNLKLEKMPILSNLVKASVGYIGQRELVLEQLHLLILQLSFFHSYHDLQFIIVFSETEMDQWFWLRWLPHIKLQDANIRGFVYDQRSCDQVMNALNHRLKDRKKMVEQTGNNKTASLFTPHYVLIITDEKLILDHSIMDILNEETGKLSCSVVYVKNELSSLSDYIKTIIDIRDKNTGILLLEEGDLKEISFKPDHFPEEFDFEELPRLLAPLNHLQTIQSAIPETVTFFELYGVKSFEELGVIERWRNHSPHKTLSVPIGMRGNEEKLLLNLHEKAHGPHGLIAGTTGSGKSELLQTYILSLAVNFHPHDLAFLLIDYKGGGLANLFSKLPHMLGSITNLDGSQSRRALMSINAELKRRQKLFAENDVNHINQYQILYKRGVVLEPLPHLFLISDEFAELKSEQPEFMSELISVSRIGRSLGIHLILATQKPSGVVNDQIWSNSNAKLCLKVADRSDSMEMLKTPDASELVQPGRAYLQVGNNEIYELFQSAWSGAGYQPEKKKQQDDDHRIYRINELGQYELLNRDLSGLEKFEHINRNPTQLEIIIEGICTITKVKKIQEIPRPWLPPLKKRLSVNELHPADFKHLWLTEKQKLEPVLGVVDLPGKQRQKLLKINLTEEGHMVVYSSPGYGKSTLLQTVVMDLARTHNPEHLTFYLLDFGTNGLLPLKNLPHVAEIMECDENEKILKFMKRINGELKKRKVLLKEYTAASLEIYEAASGKVEPTILIVIDNFEGVKGSDFEGEFEMMLNQTAREGAAVGIHLLLSAGRQNSLRMSLSGNIKVQIPLHLIDDFEAKSIVGRTSIAIEDLPGRGLIKMEEPELFQTALPASGEDTLKLIEAIQKEVNAMNTYWMGKRPKPIPMVPMLLSFDSFKEMKAVQQMVCQGLLPLGLDFEQVEPVTFELNRQLNLALIGDSPKPLLTLKCSMLLSVELLTGQVNTVVIDSGKISTGKNLSVHSYRDQPAEFIEFKEELLCEVRRREQAGCHGQKPWLIYITEMEKFEQTVHLTEDELKKILLSAEQTGIHLIIAGDHRYMAKTRVGLPRYYRQLIQTAVFAMKISDQEFAGKSYISKEPELAESSGYYYTEKEFIKIKFVQEIS